jgi:hypothetical protein
MTNIRGSGVGISHRTMATELPHRRKLDIDHHGVDAQTVSHSQAGGLAQGVGWNCSLAIVTVQCTRDNLTFHPGSLANRYSTKLERHQDQSMEVNPLTVLATSRVTSLACNIGVVTTALLARVNRGLARIPASDVAITAKIRLTCMGRNPETFH